MTKRYWINFQKDYTFTPASPPTDSTSQVATFKEAVEYLMSQHTAQSGKPWYQAPDTTLTNAASHIASGSSAHSGLLEKLQKDGTNVTKQRIINFTGPGVTVSDDGVNGRSNVDIPGGGGGGGGSAHIIQEEGASQTARSRLNFRGVGSTASDDLANDRTNVDIRGNVARGSTAPTSPVTGELWLDTTTNPAILREYNGSVWTATSGVPSDASVTDVKVAAGAAIAKTKLGALSIDTADLATNRSLVITCTSTTRPSSPATGQHIYETDSQNDFINTGTPSVPVWRSVIATQTYQAKDLIGGLMLTWDGANTLGIETGAAYIPGSSSVLEVPTRLTRAVSFAASSTAWNYIYLWDNGGSPDILHTTDAPASPYMGTARTKGVGGTAASTLHRYLGAILPNGVATPAMRKWAWRQGNQVLWLDNVRDVPFMARSNGLATSETSTSCAAVVPPTSKLVKIHLWHNSTSSLYLGNSEDNVTTGSNQGIITSYQLDRGANVDFPLDSSQSFTYRFSSAPASGDGLWAHVQGYYEER